MSLAERFQGADETDKQLLEAFEAMRGALQIVKANLTDDGGTAGGSFYCECDNTYAQNGTVCRSCDIVNAARAALALADKVTR